MPGSPRNPVGVQNTTAPGHLRGFTSTREFGQNGVDPVNVSGNVGALTAIGFAVVVALNLIVAPPTGALTTTGFAPTAAVSNNQTVATGLGALTATGIASSAIVNTIVAPGLGAPTASGFAPTPSVSNNQNVATATGTVLATGYASAIVASDNSNVPTGTGVVDIYGFAPSVAGTPEPIVTGGIRWIGPHRFAPRDGHLEQSPVRVVPRRGNLRVTGMRPVVAVSDHRKVLAGTGTLILDSSALSITSSDHQIINTSTGRAMAFSRRPRIYVEAIPIVIETEPVFERSVWDADADELALALLLEFA